MSVRVVVVGSTNLDLVFSTPQLPRPGETVLGEDFRTVPGGKGANQAVAAARAGAACDFVGAVGEDEFGTRLRASLVDSGVGVSRLRTVPGPSGVALIAVDRTAENFIVVAPGANAALTELTEADRATIGAADVLLLQLEVPLATVTQAAGWARAAGTTVVLNAAPAATLPAELLDLVDVLVVNEHEAATVAGMPAAEPGALPCGESAPLLDALLDALLARVPRVVLTLGARGAAYGDRSGLRLAVPAPRVDAVDTTAAGDAFTGAFAVSWAERDGSASRPDTVRDVASAETGAGDVAGASAEIVAASLRWACAAGAACAQRAGASTALPERAAIDALHDATYRGDR